MGSRNWPRALTFALLLVASCDPVPLALCGQIPPDGCPVGRGGTCDDVTCAALYDCVEGDWVLAEQCSGNPTGGAGGGVGGGAAGAGGACTAQFFDHTTEVDGCTPDLQDPDCPAQAAETCPGACLTGCVDFYMCQARGWELVGYCTRDGQLEVIQGQGQ